MGRGFLPFPPSVNESLEIPPRLELMISSLIIFDVVILQFYLYDSKSDISKTLDELKTTLKRWTEKTIVRFKEKALILIEGLDQLQAWFYKTLIIALNSFITLQEKHRRNEMSLPNYCLLVWHILFCKSLPKIDQYLSDHIDWLFKW